MRIWLFAFLLISINGWSQTQQNLVQLKVEKWQMPSGMTVLFYEDHSAPLISYQTWFKVGSRMEVPQYTGIAHLFEHMMFKGTNKYPAKELERSLKRKGIVNNAYTTQDHTVYFEILPSQELEMVMDIESDRMRNLIVTDEQLKSELEVVKEERRMRVDNRVEGTLFENLFATVFKVHNYHWPVIGWMEDLNRMDFKKCQDFYHSFYAPNNAVLMIAGDFQMAAAKNLVQKYYGAMQPQSFLQRNSEPEPEQFSERVKKVDFASAQAPTLLMAYRTTQSHRGELPQWQDYALDLVSQIMGDGNSSRLYKRLVRELAVATNVGVFHENLDEYGLWIISVSLRPGMSVEKAKDAIDAEMWKLLNNPVSNEELQRAKVNQMTDFVNAMKTTHGKASAIAESEVRHGSYQVLSDSIEQYQKLTADQLQQVAKQFLQKTKRSVIWVENK